MSKKIILLLGAPGVGKGVYSKMLSKYLNNIPILSLGDELRKKSSLDQEFKQRMSKGELLPNEYVSDIVDNILKDIFKVHQGVILDGYPRNYAQAKEFKQNHKMEIGIVINFTMKSSILLKKALGRRICLKCNTNYNICDINEGDYRMPPILPKNSGKCDKCSDTLIQRKDDNEETILKRLGLYEESSKEVLKYYEEQKILYSIELKKGIEDFGLVKNIVNNQIPKF